MKRTFLSLLSFFFAALAATLLIASTKITLDDGTVLEGDAKRLVNGTVSIKTAAGGAQLIPAARISKIEGDLAADNGGAAKPPAAGAAKGGAVFGATKAKADRVTDPLLAVQIWDKFIDENGSSPDLAAAKAEREKWDVLVKAKALKVKGKWLSGDELKAFRSKYDDLIREGITGLEGTQTVLGLQKMEEALKMYPESFDANFYLGRFYLIKGVSGNGGRGDNASLDKGVKSLEMAAKVMPESAATWSNLAIAYNFRKRYEEAVLVAYKAAKMEDSPGTVQNLVNAIMQAPPAMRKNNKKVLPIIDDAQLLASKHGVQPGSWIYVTPTAPQGDRIVEKGDKDEERLGHVWSGSGFFITPDGYFITNHHVATGDPKTAIVPNITFRIKMDDGTEKNAELIAVDDKADIALMKVKTDTPLPFFEIADGNPNQGAAALVLGYPATGDENATLQTSVGDVKSVNLGDEHEVWFNLSTTHGNSGGPIVDKGGRVISILTGGRKVYDMVIVYGVGPMQIKRFLDSLGDKAPKVTYAAPKTDVKEFNAENLIVESRKSTLYVMAIRVNKEDASKGAAAKEDADVAKPGVADKAQPGKEKVDTGN